MSKSLGPRSSKSTKGRDAVQVERKGTLEKKKISEGANKRGRGHMWTAGNYRRGQSVVAMMEKEMARWLGYINCISLSVHVGKTQRVGAPLWQSAWSPLSCSHLIDTLLRNGEVLCRVQNGLASPFLKSTLHWNDYFPSSSIQKTAPKIIKRKRIKALLWDWKE